MIFARIDGKYTIIAKQLDPDNMLNELTRAIRMISQDMDQNCPGDGPIFVYNDITDQYDAVGKHIKNPMRAVYLDYVHYARERIRNRSDLTHNNSDV